MAEEKDKLITNDDGVKEEISFDEIEQATGGSIKNVQYTKTVEISDDTRSKI